VKGKGLIRYVVAVVDTKRKTVDVRTVSGVIVLTRGVPWSELPIWTKARTPYGS